MKRTACLGLLLLLIGASAIPSFAQASTPDGLYTIFFNEMDPAKKVALGEQFINNADPAFKSSQYLPYIFQTVFNSYVGGNNLPKAMETADKLGTLVPNANNNLKGFVFGSTMALAYQANNAAKTVEYGDKLLAIDPTNINALMFIPTALIGNLPQAAPAKEAALSKAQDYSTKLLAQPKPMGVGDPDWNSIRAQAHFNVGFAQLSKNQLQEAITSFEESIKLNKKDDQAHYQLGIAYSNQLPDLQKQVLAAYEKENAAKSARADSIQIDELAATRQALEEDYRAKRDLAIDSFARAVAIAGPVKDPARQQLDRLWKAKHDNSMDGLEAFIAAKKAELGD
jgi:tetratricopeptide (TPR) repeat protein